MVLAEELAEGGEEVGLDEAREGFGEEAFELGGVSPVGSFQELDGLDCFDAKNPALDEGSPVVPGAAPNRSVGRPGSGLKWSPDG